MAKKKHPCIPQALARCRPHAPEAVAQSAPGVDVIPARKAGVRAQLLTFGLGALIVMFTACLYASTLRHDKLLDDTSYVFDNALLGTGKSFLYPISLAEFINDAGRRGLPTDLAVNFVLRPVTYATFFWNRCLHGSGTAGYRVVNIAIHAGNALLLWLLASRLLAVTGAGGNGRWVGALAALLFAVHPVMTESVTYITQRFESLSTLFVLSAACVWVWQRQTAAAGARPLILAAQGTISVIFTLLAMLSKETGVVTPVLLLLVTWLVLGERPLDGVVAVRGHLLCLPILPLLLAAAVFICNSRLSFSAYLNITNHPSAPLFPLHYAVSELPVWAAYLGVLLWPARLRFDPLIAPCESAWEPRLWVALLVCITLLLAGWIAWRRHRRSGGGVVFFGILWFFIALLPSSSIFPLPDLYAEHRTYLPSVGLFLALGVVMTWVWEKWSLPFVRRMLLVATVACVTLLSAATLRRNDELRDAVRLYRGVVADNPDHARAWLILGSELACRDDLKGAAGCLDKALECPNPPPYAFVNQGTILLKLGQVARAFKVTMQGLDKFPDQPRLLHNAGVAHILSNRAPEAEKYLVRALQLAPALWEATLPLSHVYYHTKRPAEALRLLEQADRMHPLPDAEARLLDELRQRSSTTAR